MCYRVLSISGRLPDYLIFFSKILVVSNMNINIYFLMQYLSLTVVNFIVDTTIKNALAARFKSEPPCKLVILSRTNYDILRFLCSSNMNNSLHPQQCQYNSHVDLLENGQLKLPLPRFNVFQSNMKKVNSSCLILYMFLSTVTKNVLFSEVNWSTI